MLRRILSRISSVVEFNLSRLSCESIRKSAAPHFGIALSGAVLFAVLPAVAGAQTATTTTLAVTSGTKAVSTVIPGSVVTLTATVEAGATPLTAGQVDFCDASAKYCTDIHLLATAQLTKAGTAVFKFRPGVGSHSYKAAFRGTVSNAMSASGASSLTVATANGGGYATTTSIAQYGVTGYYTLTATVAGPGQGAPTGSVSFLDTTTGSVLEKVALEAVPQGIGWLQSMSPAMANPQNLIAVADFNGDGIPDLAVMQQNNSSDMLTVMLGKGDGTFAIKKTVPIGYGTNSMVVGDFNGDGIPDVAVGYLGSSNAGLAILLGAGDGTFTSAANSPLTAFQSPAQVTSGDFNRDGNLDLAVYDSSSNTITILLGNGNGTFTAVPGVPVSTSTYIGPIIVGDFNGDGILDMAMMSPGIRVLLGNGDGTFKPAPASSVTASYYSDPIAAADVNGDGILDLVLANISNKSVTTLIGKGDGTFTQALNSHVDDDDGLGSVAIGDFNGDGIPDLAITEPNDGEGEVVISFGNGDGTFTQAQANPATGSDSPAFVAIGDFNGDGVPDLAVANGYIKTASVLLALNQPAVATADGISVQGAGTHLVKASYPGDSEYAASTSGTVSLLAPAPSPVFSISSGTYTSAQTVKLTDTLAAATIHYTTDGTAATTNSPIYKAPITVSYSETIQAVAEATGYTPSPASWEYYNIYPTQAAAPVFSLPSGTYSSPQKVTITDATPGTGICYATNGLSPYGSFVKYTGPVTVSTSETLIAMASIGGYCYGPLTSAQYIIASAPSSMIYTHAGTGNLGFFGDNGPAIAANLSSPAGTALDPDGNLYIADTYNNRVRMIAAGSGIITTVAGNGVAGNLGDNGPATSAQLNNPLGVALDSNSNLYIVDSDNNAIRMVSASTKVITTVAGNGIGGTLAYPNGIAIDSSNNLYIADTLHNSVKEVYAGTGTMAVVAGGSGSYGCGGDNGPATNAGLSDPAGIAVDSAGNLYIADTGNNLIREVIKKTGVITTVVGQSSSSGYCYNNSGYSGDGGPATNAQLNRPSSVVIDGAGNLLIADAQNNAIRKLTTATGIISTVAGNGSYAGMGCYGDTGDGGPATSADLCNPVSVSADSAGNLYIADNEGNRIRKATVSSLPPTSLTASPVPSVSAGSYAAPQVVSLTSATPGAAIYITLDGTAPTPASLGYNGPISVTGAVTIKAIAIAPGYLQSAVATAAYSITSPPTAVMTTVAGSGVSGLAGDGGPAVKAQMDSPTGVTLDGAGNIYITDPNNSVVWKVTAKTGIITLYAGNREQKDNGDGGPATSASLNYPEHSVADAAGNLYIADTQNNMIRVVSADADIITTIAGVWPGWGGYSGDGGQAGNASLSYPTGLALDNAGNLYVSDTDNYVVRKISLTSGIITTVAGNHATYNFSGDGGLATNAGLGLPGTLALDGTGNLYITSRDRVRKVAAGSGIITTVAGNGNPGYSGDGGLATQAELTPYGVAADKSDNLYIASYPGVIRMVSATSGIITTVAGNGYCSSNSDGGSATVAGMCTPSDIVLDSVGNFYIVDSGNQKVRKVTFAGSIPATAAPTFSPAGGSYAAVQSVTIADATSGATIYYTTDGTAPTTSSKTYSGPISISSTETLEAMALAKNYSQSATVTATYTITIPKTTPTITWAAPAAITYGTALSATQLKATSTTPGTFVYTPPAGKVLTAGSQTLSVTFTPTDQSKYSTNTATVKLTVNPATLTVTAASASRIYGAANPSTFTDTITGFVNGDTAGAAVTGAPTLSTTATAASPAGTYPITATAGSLAAANYTFKFVAGTLTVTKAPLVITASGATVPYNQPLPKFTYTAAGFVNGDKASILTGAPAETTTAKQGSAVGTYPIAIAQGTLAAASYSFQFLPGTLSITSLGTTASPSFSPAAGTYTAAQTVAITDATKGAVIYYTTNGTTPTTSSAKYTAAIKVTATETIQAIAVAPGYIQSPSTTSAYTITLPAATPTFTPAAGTYTAIQTVTIKDATAGATIYYTTDGTTPTTSSTPYSVPIAVASTETIKAAALAPGSSLSAVGSAVYTINLPAATPVFSPAAGVYTSAQTVTMTDATSGATIYYTTNGTTPTTSSTKYTSAGIKVAATETIKAIAVATGSTTSAVASAAYVIATAPAATTAAATNLSSSGATLNGTVTANNAATQYWFAWGTAKTSLTNTTATVSGLTGATATPVTAALAGLTTRTTYYFQLVASNAVGKTPGSVLSFTTK